MKSMGNIVIFGETGAGKSSVINLMAGRRIATTSPDSHRCTMHWKEYTVTFDDKTQYQVFDTVGLEEPLIQPEEYPCAITNAYDLINALKERGGIHLLLFCMRGGRVTATMQSNYRLFFEFLCEEKVPLALVVTNLEREKRMEDWYTRHGVHLEEHGIRSLGHACITAATTLDGRYKDKYEESRKIIRSVVQAYCSDESGIHANEPILRDLSAYITKVGAYRVARGGFRETRKYHCQTPVGPIKVAVKALLVYAADQLEGVVTNEKKLKRIRRELETGAKLQHKNILPVYGYTYGFGKFIAMVSPWAEKGSLLAYLETENAALTPVRRSEILGDISAGLYYLHANDVVHGNLAASNVLIHGDGTACLCDFGLPLVLSEVMGSSSVTLTLRRNCRWVAPELLNVQENEPPALPNKMSDIYSFGGIMLHVLTGQMPYYYLRNDAQVINTIINRVNPHRSRYSPIADKYWYLVEHCWETVPQDRPSTGQVDEVINAGLYFRTRRRLYQEFRFP